MKQMKKRVKGFTLTELVVVLAIIGVLAAMLVPTMISYYRSSQIKSSNADAKMVYNSVQTELQRYISIDRTREEGEKSLFNGTIMISYNRNGTVSYTTETSSAFIPVEDDSESVSKEEEACDAIVNAVHRVVSDSDSFNWAVYIENYMVKACISAPFDNSRFVGQCSAGRTAATEMSVQQYSQLLAANGENNVLVNIAEEKYDAITEQE